MSLESIKKSFSQIEGLSTEDLGNLLKDKDVLVGFNKLLQNIPSYYKTIENLIDESKDFNKIDTITDKSYNKVGVKFKINRKPNGIYTLTYIDGDGLYLSYSIDDVDELLDVSIKNNFTELISKELEKEKNSINPFYGKDSVNILETIVETYLFGSKYKPQPIKLYMGNKILIHSEEFKEYFTETLTPYLKSITTLIQKKIKESTQMNTSSNKSDIKIFTKYVIYDSNGEYETHTEINSHSVQINKKVIDEIFIINGEFFDEELDDNIEKTKLLTNEEVEDYVDFGRTYRMILDNINYCDEIKKFYRKTKGSIFFNGFEIEVEYEGDKETFKIDFVELKSDDDELYDYYEDYVVWFKNGEIDSNRFK